MPRKSPEARAASLYLARLKTPLKPPPDLDETAAQLWGEVVSTFPADRFDRSNAPLLKRFCRTAVYVEALHDELCKHEIGTAKHGQLHRQLMSGTNNLIALAASL